VPNKATLAVRTLAHRLLSNREYRHNLRERLRAGTAGHLEVVLWHYAYGKPKDAREHDGADVEPENGNWQEELARRLDRMAANSETTKDLEISR